MFYYCYIYTFKYNIDKGFFNFIKNINRGSPNWTIIMGIAYWTMTKNLKNIAMTPRTGRLYFKNHLNIFFNLYFYICLKNLKMLL